MELIKMFEYILFILIIYSLKKNFFFLERIHLIFTLIIDFDKSLFA